MGFHSHGCTPISGWFVVCRENPIYKWMITRGSPICGTPIQMWEKKHVAFLFNDLKMVGFLHLISLQKGKWGYDVIQHDCIY